MIICGIDPGLSGGITIIERLFDGRHENISIMSMPMPTVDIGKKKVLDVRSINTILRCKVLDLVVIEKVGAMPGQGVTSMFSFGYGAGILEGIVSSLYIPYELARPQEWMKKVLTGLPKGSDSKASILWCQRKFPDIDWRGTERSKKPHDGKTDSCCLAWYGLLMK